MPSPTFIHTLGLVEVETYDNTEEQQLAAAHDIRKLYEWAEKWAVSRRVTLEWSGQPDPTLTDITKPFDWAQTRYALFITPVQMLDSGPREADVLAMLADFKASLEEERAATTTPVDEDTAEYYRRLAAQAPRVEEVFGPRCTCTAQGGSVYSSGCPVHDQHSRP